MNPLLALLLSGGRLGQVNPQSGAVDFLSLFNRAQTPTAPAAQSNPASFLDIIRMLAGYSQPARQSLPPVQPAAPLYRPTYAPPADNMYRVDPRETTGFPPIQPIAPMPQGQIIDNGPIMIDVGRPSTPQIVDTGGVVFQPPAPIIPEDTDNSLSRLIDGLSGFGRRPAAPSNSPFKAEPSSPKYRPTPVPDTGNTIDLGRWENQGRLDNKIPEERQGGIFPNVPVGSYS